MIELLAPVGSREALTAAVENGADAVYLAGKAFGARAFASNFDRQGLLEALDFAHRRDVAVHVTVNTLVDNGEIPELEQYLHFLRDAGADAIIVQDLGVAALAQHVVPDLPLHASTQMTLHNLDGVLAAAELGFSRAVLARELSLEEIAAICEASPIEIEVFAHGALCVCYSGQCLMSSLIGGRSGNRGKCAQPCRMPYRLIDKEGRDLLKGKAGAYLLSPRDLNTLELIPELKKTGIASLKIEGRMKRPEYVAAVTQIYRKALDNLEISSQEQKDLAQIFSRGFTTGYLKTPPTRSSFPSKPGKTMMSDDQPNNRGILAGQIIQHRDKDRKIALKLQEALKTGDILEFRSPRKNQAVTVSSMVRHTGKTTVPAVSAQPGETVEIPVPAMPERNAQPWKVLNAALMERLRPLFKPRSAIRRIPLDAEVSAAEGSHLEVTVSADGLQASGSSDFIGEAAQTRPLTAESLREQFNRLGSTVYRLQNFHCRIAGDVIYPASEINLARRRAVEALDAARLARFRRPPQEQPSRIKLPQRIRKEQHPLLIAAVDSIEKARAALQAGADGLLFGGESYSHRPIPAGEYQEAMKLSHDSGKIFVMETPRILRGSQIDELYRLLEKLHPGTVSVHSLGTAQIARQSGAALWGGISLNIANSLAIQLLARQGFTGVTLSPELTLSHCAELAERSPIPLECVVHGPLELMVSEHCPLGSFLGGLHQGICPQPCRKGPYWLVDRKGEAFPIVTDQYCRMHLLNAMTLDMLPYLHQFGRKGIARVRIDGKSLNSRALAAVTRLYRQKLDQKPDSGSAKSETPQGITRGHYFRGAF